MSSVRTAAPALLVAALLALAACGSADLEESSQSSVTPSTSQSPSTSPVPSATATPTPSESSAATQAATPTGTLRSLLLPAASLPGFNDEWSWSQGRTGPEKGPVGVCQRFPMTTLGAERSVMRSYLPTGDLTGGTGTQVVARFVDDTSTAQALAVLRSWHDRCADRLSSYPFKRVGAITPVDTARGSAFRYLVGYRPDKGSGRFDDLGVLRSGTTIEVLLLRLRGQDYNYPAGKDPMAAALQRAAERLS